ncbi:hypothetical protein ACKWTF_015350 [Chironomus riparius]
MVLLEICVDSVESIQNAVYGGADRIELCSALSEGGLTPNVGLFCAAKRITKNTKSKIFTMIRIRGGNFNYSNDELSAMIEEVKYFKDNHADGIVFGALTENYQIDIEACKKILDAWGNDKPATFHRAFDETHPDDISKNLKVIEDLGFARILTSGLEGTAEAGIKNIQKMMQLTEKLIIMPGSGLNINNVQFIVNKTGCKEVHGSARTEMDISTRISVGGSTFYVCDKNKVEKIYKLLKI